MRSGYIRGSGYVAFITMLYPIAWACSEGGNVISPTSEMVWYGILDLLLGPVFLYYFIFSLRNLDYASFGLQSWKYSDTGYGAGVGAGNIGGGPGAGRNAKAAEAGFAGPSAAPNPTAPGASNTTAANAGAPPATNASGVVAPAGPAAANAV